jgi:hypothetical protein
VSKILRWNSELIRFVIDGGYGMFFPFCACRLGQTLATGARMTVPRRFIQGSKENVQLLTVAWIATTDISERSRVDLLLPGRLISAVADSGYDASCAASDAEFIHNYVRQKSQ